MEPLKEFGKTVLSLDNCVIPNERLLNTPSAKDGMSHELEVALRTIGCEYIQSAGLMLKLPQVAMATAQILFQRFFYSKSFVKFSVQPLAMACIFLAAKIEEDCRRIRDVVNVFHYLRQKRTGRPVVPMDYMGEEYFRMKSTVVKYERFVLKELGFCVHVNHPHKVIITYLQMLDMEPDKNKALVQKAWNFMNDSLRTNVFVRFSPETIACACMFLAARQLKIPMPQRPPWWLVFDCTYEDIEVIAQEILALYQQPKRSLEELEKEVAVLKEKKHIEIKEITLTKADSTVSSRNASPNPASPMPASAEHQETSKSPASSSLAVPRVKLGRSPLLPTPPISSTTKGVQSEDCNQEFPSLKNGEKMTLKRVTQQSSSFSPSPQPQQSQGSSPNPTDSSTHSRSSSSHSPPAAYKPIHSPIKLSSSEHSAQSPEHSPVGYHENGVPEQYRIDYEHDRRVRKSHHKHRTDKREGHRHRDTSHHRRHDRGHRREREHYRPHKTRDRSVDKERRRRDDMYRR